MVEVLVHETVLGREVEVVAEVEHFIGLIYQIIIQLV